MNTSEKSAGRGSGRKRLGVTSLVLTVAVLLSACAPGGGSPPPKDDGNDREAAPPAHFVLSITPRPIILGTSVPPTVTITIPPPTDTVSIPETTIPKTTVPPPTDTITIPTSTRPPLTGTVVPTTIPADPTIPHPTIWDPPPVDDETAGSGEDGSTSWWPKPPKRVVLACNPDAGTHPDPGAACKSLRNVNGVFEDLPVDPAALCTNEYAPVYVEAIGYWGNRRVEYREWFNNPCLAAVSTDYVFSFLTA